MKNDRMSLDTRAFGLAAGAMAGVIFTLCALAVAVAPGATAAFFSYILHADLTGLARSMTWGSFVGGLLGWTIGVGIVFAAAGALYNRFLHRLPAVARADATANRVA